MGEYVYAVLLIMATVLIVVDLLGKRKRKLRVARKSKFELNSQLIDKIDDFLKSYNILYRVKESYVKKLGVINTNKRRHNNGIAIGFIAISIITTLIISILLLTVMNMWYVIVVLAVLNLYFMNYGFTLYLNVKLKKIYSQFPVALQLFTDIYISNRNIKVALNNSYLEMPYEVGIVFEKLARRLASGHDYKKHIREFAQDINYVWAYSFSELLLMSYEGSGDISDDLLFINELINEDLQDAEESKTEMATNKMLFLILNTCTLLAFVINNLFNPIAKQLYFYTSTGNTIIMIWLIVIAIGIAGSTVLDKL